MSQRPPTVTVFGSSDPLPDSDEFLYAFEVGAILGQLGYAVANGGYDGTMTASAKGCQAAGGHTIGVTCSIWKSPPNQWITEVIPTENHTERLETLIELGTHGYVVLPGSTGTLLELAAVWEYRFKGILPEKPIVCMGAWFWSPLLDMMNNAREGARECVQDLDLPDQLRSIFPDVRKPLSFSE